MYYASNQRQRTANQRVKNHWAKKVSLLFRVTFPLGVSVDSKGTEIPEGWMEFLIAL